MSKKKARGGQVPTKETTTESIMLNPHFARGLDDIRAGRPFAEAATGDAAWAYERGRLFGAIAPLTMPLFINGGLNPKAISLCNAAFERRLIT